MHSSLTEVWESLAAQKALTGTWRRILNGVLGELIEIKEESANTMKAVGTNAAEIIRRFAEEVESTRKGNQEAAIYLSQVLFCDQNFPGSTEHANQLIHRTASGLESLEEQAAMISKGAEMVVEEISTGATAQYEVIKLNSDLVQKVSLRLRSEHKLDKYLTSLIR